MSNLHLQSKNQPISSLNDFNNQINSNKPLCLSLSQITSIPDSVNTQIKACSSSMDNSSTPITTNNQPKAIILDLQNEINEDQELLDLIVEPKTTRPKSRLKSKPKSKSKAKLNQKPLSIQIPTAISMTSAAVSKQIIDNNSTGKYRVLYQYHKQQDEYNKIEMIPEEDEDKQKYKFGPKIEISHKQPKMVKNFSESRFKTSNRNIRHRKLDSLTNVLNKDNYNQRSCLEHVTSQTRLNKDNEKKQIEEMLLVLKESKETKQVVKDNIRKFPIITDDTHNSFKKAKDKYRYGDIITKLGLINPIPIHNYQTPRNFIRPFSNPKQVYNNDDNYTEKDKDKEGESERDKEDDSEYIYSSQRKVNEYLRSRGLSNKRNNNNNVITNTPLTEFGYNNYTTKHGSGDIEVNRIFNRDRVKLRPLRKIKIEKGLTSSKLVEQFARKLTLNYSQSAKNITYQQQRNITHMTSE